MRRVSPKILRLRNGVGATYFLNDTFGYVCKMAFNCPTCGKRCRKGDNITKGSYLSQNNSFHIRHKLFCGEECVPREIKSK